MAEADVPDEKKADAEVPTEEASNHHASSSSSESEEQMAPASDVDATIADFVRKRLQLKLDKARVSKEIKKAGGACN